MLYVAMLVLADIGKLGILYVAVVAQSPACQSHGQGLLCYSSLEVSDQDRCVILH